MRGKVIVLAGDMGCGKTSLIALDYFAKTNRKKYRFVRRSATLQNNPTPIQKRIFSELQKSKEYKDFIPFINKMITETNSIITIDEAFSVVPKQINVKNEEDEKLMTLLVNTREANNFLFFIYHTLRDIPIWLIGYADYFIRYRTNDLFQFQRNRFMSFPEIVKSIDENNITENFVYDEIKIR